MNWGWLWCFPASGTSDTRFFRRRLLPVVCDFDDLHLAAVGNYFGARCKGVRIDTRENGALGHAVAWIFEVEFIGVEFSEIQNRGICFFPGQKLGREVAEIEIDSV